MLQNNHGKLVTAQARLISQRIQQKNSENLLALVKVSDQVFRDSDQHADCRISQTVKLMILHRYTLYRPICCQYAWYSIHRFGREVNIPSLLFQH